MERTLNQLKYIQYIIVRVVIVKMAVIHEEHKKKQAESSLGSGNNSVTLNCDKSEIKS